jgi:hypothetical protein
MFRLISALTLALFLAPVGATHVYKGWAEDNPDLSGHREQSDFAAMELRERVDTGVDIYRGLDEGNRDLYTPPQTRSGGTPDPQIYRGFRESPDLTW